MTVKPKRRAGYSTVYAIFEGGGAKGIGHIGALKALEDEGFALAGVAGASAGAIIAALAAVGYTPDEIFSDEKNNIFKTIGLESPIDMLGKRNWLRLRHLKSDIIKGSVAILSAIISSILSFSVNYSSEYIIFRNMLFYVSMIFLIVGLYKFVFSAFPVFNNWGMLDSTILRDAVNEALRLKLKKHYKDLGKSDPVPDIVLFEHIDPKRIKRCIPLKIVVTNITSGQLILFDKRFAQTPVAEVVAASAALPFVFRPATIPSYTHIRNALFADGGLVSNLPAWAFRDERKALERDEASKGGGGTVPIYAFSLNQAGSKARAFTMPKDNRTNIRGAIRYGMDVLSTGIFGSQDIVQEFVPGLKVITLQPGLSTLAFDCSAKQAKEAVDLAYGQAAASLEHQRRSDILTNKALEDILISARTEIANLRGTAPARLRIALIDPICRSSESDVVGFRVVAGANMGSDADDALELDLRGEIAPAAFLKDRAVYGKVDKVPFNKLLMTKYEHALLPKNLHSVIAVPVYARPDEPSAPCRVLALDSEDDLEPEFNNEAFMQAILTASAKVSRTFIDDLIGSTTNANA